MTIIVLFFLPHIRVKIPCKIFTEVFNDHFWTVNCFVNNHTMTISLYMIRMWTKMLMILDALFNVTLLRTVSTTGLGETKTWFLEITKFYLKTDNNEHVWHDFITTRRHEQWHKYYPQLSVTKQHIYIKCLLDLLEPLLIPQWACPLQICCIYKEFQFRRFYVIYFLSGNR